MAVRHYARDHLVPAVLRVVDGALSQVDARDEEGGLHLVGGELVQDLVRVLVRPVVLSPASVCRVFVEGVFFGGMEGGLGRNCEVLGEIGTGWRRP